MRLKHPIALAGRRGSSKTIENLSISTVLALFTIVTGAVVGVYEKFLIPAREQTLTEKIVRIEAVAAAERKRLEETVTGLEDKNRSLESQREKLLDQMARPALLGPNDGDVLINTEVIFSWDYSNQRSPTFSQYIIEISHIEAGNLTTRRFNVVQPDRRIFILPIPAGQTGRYLWRIKPGRIVDSEEFSAGPWSALNSFSVYRSPIEKIRETKELVVGMYPQFNDKFNRLEEGGRFSGFSVDLAQYLANELSGSLLGGKAQIKVRIQESNWQELLPKLARGEFDIVISSLTATIAREQKYDIKFSVGYYTSSQILLSSGLSFDSKRGLFNNLRGRKIGVLANSTNERAAKFLANKCQCSITVLAYRQLVEVTRDLFARKIDLVLADNIFATGEIELGNFRQFGPPADSELKEFYQSEYGRPRDEYSIAMRDLPNDELLKYINGVLESGDGRAHVAAFRKKHAI